MSPEKLLGLTNLTSQAVVNTATAKSLLEEMFKTGKDADTLVREQGLAQISDIAELEKVAEQVIQSNTQAVVDYRVGKAQSLAFLVGQVMKATRGRANPKLVTEVLKKKLGEV
ncbi:MAG: hypothetical protein HYX85_01115 [Chloroflexi bacterium]|nr:hypothetical protein [Chloroflexota bacterium]